MHYTGTIWRPPYEADSLLLEVTAGCTHHKCKFCTLYAELPFQFRMSPMVDIENDLLEARAVFKQQQARGLFKLWPNSAPARAFLTGSARRNCGAIVRTCGIYKGGQFCC